MAFDDAALERALRAETKHGLTLYCNGETLTALGYEWMAVVPMDGLRERLRGTLGALVEMLGYIPENDTVRIVRNKGGYAVKRSYAAGGGILPAGMQFHADRAQGL